MLVPPFLECTTSEASVVLCTVLGGDIGDIYNFILLAILGGEGAACGSPLQLQPWAGWELSFISSLVLWGLIKLPILGMHLYEIFTLLLFRSFLRGLSGGKDVSMIQRNCFPTFVFTAEFQGGLNQVTFLFLEFFLWG